MRFRLLFLFQYQLVINAFITYDSGQAVHDNSIDGFDCQNGLEVYSTYTFSGEFENVPQVFMTLEHLDENLPTVTVSYTITSITELDFSIKVLCNDNQVWVINMQWIAIDDQRVEIINIFDSTSFGQNTISHSNPNALYGFPSLICFSYDAAFSLDITINEITSTEIKYTVGNDGGLLGVSFQIFLTTEEGLSFIESRQNSDEYTSIELDLKENYWLVVPYVGFNFANTDQIREFKNYVTTSTSIQYQITYSISQTPNTIYAAWIAYVFTKEFLPMQISRITTAQFNDCSQNLPFNTVFLVELNEYISSFGQTQLQIDKSINDLNVEILTTCDQGIIYDSSFNACNSCSEEQKIRQFSLDCQEMQNRLGYRFRMKQSVDDYQQLSIELSSTGVQIKQILFNQIITENIIVDIQLKNQ